MTICPCQKKALPTHNIEPATHYQNCCQPYHLGTAQPTTAEQLMRSRYSSYVLENIDYIVTTTVPAQQAFLDRQSIANWAKQTNWAGLEIITHQEKLGKRHAQVEFKAWFKTEDDTQAHHELSAFVQIVKKLSTADNTLGKEQNEKHRWFFLDPTVNMTLTQKQPCFCGSGEKFKRCCSQFL